MMRAIKIAALLVAALLAFIACGQSQKVGSEKLTGFEEQKQGPRLGEKAEASPTGSPESLAVGGKSPTAAPPSPAPEEQFFDVSLVADSPYYEPGNAIVIPVGFTLRVTNRDATPERPKRSFTSSTNSFDSGLLSPGASWTRKFDRSGFFEIVDKGLTFAVATLEVR